MRVSPATSRGGTCCRAATRCSSARSRTSSAARPRSSTTTRGKRTSTGTFPCGSCAFRRWTRSRDAKAAPPAGPWALHLAEGTDAASAAEIDEAVARGLLSDRLLAVHLVGATPQGVARLAAAGCAAVWCPTSNGFLYGSTAPRALFDSGLDVLLGTDALVSGEGTLLDELRAARALGFLTDSRLGGRGRRHGEAAARPPAAVARAGRASGRRRARGAAPRGRAARRHARARGRAAGPRGREARGDLRRGGRSVGGARRGRRSEARGLSARVRRAAPRSVSCRTFAVSSRDMADASVLVLGEGELHQQRDVRPRHGEPRRRPSRVHLGRRRFRVGGHAGRAVPVRHVPRRRVLGRRVAGWYVERGRWEHGFGPDGKYHPRTVHP